MKPLSFYDFMRAAHVKRWHIIKTAEPQTLAEHSFLVAVIALELFQRLVGVKDDVKSATTILFMALFHDMPETRTGDIPTPAKRMIRDLQLGMPDIFNGIDDKLMPNIPYLGCEWPKVIDFAQMVKMADLIADAWWITENKVGIHSDVVAKANVRSMMERAIALDDANPDQGWLGAVNAILQELGMPYISRSLRDTPP